ncbi:hypothetical protein BJV77DRAFT_959288 [Russula vinacea]|nr:hypothetical protein BJV77DRAFT_959288 [Russula vinacea]
MAIVIALSPSESKSLLGFADGGPPNPGRSQRGTHPRARLRKTCPINPSNFNCYRTPQPHLSLDRNNPCARMSSHESKARFKSLPSNERIPVALILRQQERMKVAADGQLVEVQVEVRILFGKQRRVISTLNPNWDSRWISDSHDGFMSVTLPAIETWNDGVPPSLWQGSKLIKNLWGKASKDHMGKRKDAILFADDLLSQSGGSC